MAEREQLGGEDSGILPKLVNHIDSPKMQSREKTYWNVHAKDATGEMATENFWF